MPGDSHHRAGIPGHGKTPHPSPPQKNHQLPRGSLSPPAGRLSQRGAGRGSQPQTSLAKTGQGGSRGWGCPVGGRLCWGWSCLSSVVKFGKDDPQLVSENAVFLGLLPGAL